LTNKKVADLDVYSRPQILIFIYPRSQILILFIPDPTTATKEGTKNFGFTFLCNHIIDRIENHFIVEQIKKKN
jgi:hypothetical protein